MGKGEEEERQGSKDAWPREHALHDAAWGAMSLHICSNSLDVNHHEGTVSKPRTRGD